MRADALINDLPGISPSAVVNLSRLGITTISDLVKADFEQVSVVLDCFNEGSRLVAEAKNFLAGGSDGAPSAASNWTATPARSEPEPESEPSWPGVHEAMPVAAAGLNLSRPEDRGALVRRLASVTLLLEHGLGEDAVVASLFLEAVESGSEEANQTIGRLGPGAAALLEECVQLRAIPMSPSGRLPRHYLEMAAKASRGARQVCAAHQLVLLRSAFDQPGRASGVLADGPAVVWYSRLLAEALAAGGKDGLVGRLMSTVERLGRAKAA